MDPNFLDPMGKDRVWVIVLSDKGSLLKYTDPIHGLTPIKIYIYIFERINIYMLVLYIFLHQEYHFLVK